jgi:hypothetical protein
MSKKVTVEMLSKFQYGKTGPKCIPIFVNPTICIESLLRVEDK